MKLNTFKVQLVGVNLPKILRMGAPWHYPPKTLLQFYIVGCLRRLPQRRALWRYPRDQAAIKLSDSENPPTNTPSVVCKRLAATL
jgi:hypothetical protein